MAQAHSTGMPGTPPPSVTTIMRVLVVEDEQDIAGLIKHALEREQGARVVTVGSGSAAIAAVAEETPDLIVLGIRPLHRSC